jgi:hypothetical protein
VLFTLCGVCIHSPTVNPRRCNSEAEQRQYSGSRGSRDARKAVERHVPLSLPRYSPFLSSTAFLVFLLAFRLTFYCLLAVPDLRGRIAR